MALGNWVRSRTFELLMWQRSRPVLVQRALEGRAVRRAARLAGPRLRVAAVQRDLHLTPTAEDYAAEAYTLVAAAAAYGAQVVCFPEHNGTHLLGLLPDLSDEEELALSDLFQAAAPAAERVFEATWSTLARMFGVTIVAGTIVLPDSTGQLYHTVRTYGPNGRKLGEQRKLNPQASECEWIGAGCALSSVRLPTTTLVATAGLDMHYWETGRLAGWRGAELLVNAGSSEEPFSWWAQSRGLWSRVQEEHAFGVQPMLVGSLFGIDYHGCSGIYAPLALSPAGDGILTVAADERRETVVAAELDLQALREQRRQAQTQAPRRALVERYLAARPARQPIPSPPALSRAAPAEELT